MFAWTSINGFVSLCFCLFFWRAQRTHDEDEVLHNLYGPCTNLYFQGILLLQFILQRYAFYWTKLYIVFEQTLLFRCSILTLSLNHESFFDASRLHMLFGIFFGLILDLFLRGKRSDPRCLFLLLNLIGRGRFINKLLNPWRTFSIDTRSWFQDACIQCDGCTTQHHLNAVHFEQKVPTRIKCKDSNLGRPEFGYADDETLSLVSAADAKKQAWEVNVGLLTVQWIHSSWPHMTRKRSKHEQVNASHLWSEAMNCQVTYQFAWLTWFWKQPELIRRLWTLLGRGDNPQDIEPKKDVLRVSIWSKWSQ